MSDVAGYVWAELRSTFGAAFTLEHGEQPDTIWRSAIAKLTVGELEQGLAVLLERPDGHPPNCTEFVTTCRTRARARWPRVSHDRPRAPASTSTAERALARIRRRLDGPSRETSA